MDIDRRAFLAGAAGAAILGVSGAAAAEVPLRIDTEPGEPLVGELAGVTVVGADGLAAIGEAALVVIGPGGRRHTAWAWRAEPVPSQGAPCTVLAARGYDGAPRLELVLAGSTVPLHLAPGRSVIALGRSESTLTVDVVSAPRSPHAV